MPYVKRLTRVGNSTGIVLDRPILDQIDVAPDGEVELSVQNDAIVIRAHRYATKDEFTRASRRAVDRNRKALSRLAK